ncbi:DUF350 domain-containing protein [Billgrantia sp. Q4P2]|uniref:DUF350 domain-containing protein n=1 Tax=Billgrantia sp. Q4P2 TaxID=3463857 RepID=UPI004056B561
MDRIALYLSGLPLFFLYLVTAVILLSLFMVCYSRLTPHHEWSLIRQGNVAASVAYGGSILGFVMPLSSIMTHSVSIIDFLLWGLVAFIVQIVTFFVIKGVVRVSGESLSKHITDNHLAYGILVASISIGVGMLNAASMSW